MIVDIFRRYSPLYAEKGLPHFPCHPGPGAKQVKRPLVADGFHAATLDRGRLEEWRRHFPDALVAIPTGAITRIAIIDLDVKNGRNGFQSLAQLGIDLTDHMLVRTPTNGAHIYCEYPTGYQISCSSNRVGSGIDIRANGGYVIAPPSRLAGGGTYRVENRTPPKPFPIQLLKLLTHRPPVAPSAFVPRTDDDQRIAAALSSIPSDDRETWLRIGMALRSHYGGAGRAIWDQWSATSAKYDDKVQARVWRSFRGNGVTIATVFHLAKAGSNAA